MKKMIESITGGYVSTAKVVDGALILTLPDALAPVVWRMDLGSVRSSALEVRDQKDGTYVLALKTPRNDVHDIAPFAERGQAIRALMAVSQALENGAGSGGTRAGTTTLLNSDIPPPAVNSSGIGKWITGVAAVLVLFVMISVLAHQSPQSVSFGAPAGAAGNTGSAAPLTATMGQNTANVAGVPVPADDFLRQNSKQ